MPRAAVCRPARVLVMETAGVLQLVCGLGWVPGAGGMMPGTAARGLVLLPHRRSQPGGNVY